MCINNLEDSLLLILYFSRLLICLPLKLKDLRQNFESSICYFLGTSTPVSVYVPYTLQNDIGIHFPDFLHRSDRFPRRLPLESRPKSFVLLPFVIFRTQPNGGAREGNMFVFFFLFTSILSIMYKV